MIIAQIGCLHGEMDKMYQKLQLWEQTNGKKIDLVLCCGDFQSLRDEADLAALKCPEKFKRLGGFAKYFSKEKRAPIMTLFVGGNHEASNFLRDLYYGGFVAENIYFLGYSNVIRVTKGGHSLRVAGISGIEKSHDALRGYFEEWPYVHREKNLASMYHIRTFEVAKLKAYKGQPVDFFISHEWPTIATSHRSFWQNPGFQQLLRYKPFFKKEIQRGELGSPLLSQLMESIQPRLLWCAAHLHCQYRISVPIAQGRKFVEFQSLDKPEGNKRFADVFAVEFPATSSVQATCAEGDLQEQHDPAPVLSRSGLTQTWDNNTAPGGTHRNSAAQQMFWAPKNQQTATGLESAGNAEEETKQQVVRTGEEEKKSEEENNTDDTRVRLAYDRDWLAILSLSQTMIPLDNNAPDFSQPLLSQQSILDKKNELAALDEASLQIEFDPATTYDRFYERVHPQTRLFIEKFGLDGRLFEARAPQRYDSQHVHQSSHSQQMQFRSQYEQTTSVAVVGQKRTHQELKQAKESDDAAAQVPVPIVAAAAATTKDENEIDLDDL